MSEGSVLICDISGSAPEYRLFQQLTALVITTCCIVEAREIFASAKTMVEAKILVSTKL